MEDDNIPNKDSIKNHEPQERFDHDALWKDLIERFFYQMLRRAAPELCDNADTAKPPRYLDKEFTDILNTGDAKIHKSARCVDFLIEVPPKEGTPQWVLLHIEAQGRGGGALPDRMNHYRSLIHGHYRREPVALALITDRRPAGEPEYYAHNHFGTEVVYRYNRLVVSELNADDLQKSDNPFDLILYAAQMALTAGKDENRKFKYIRTSMQLLGERGWSREEKRDVMLFLERVINLKDEVLIARLIKCQEDLEKEGKVMYVSLAERKGRQEGRQEGILLGEQKGRQEGILLGEQKGRQEEKRAAARKLLERNLPVNEIAEITELSEDEIRSLTN